MSVAEPLVLGIESSCDETGVGIVRGRTLLANAVATLVRFALFRQWVFARGHHPSSRLADPTGKQITR